MNSRTTRRDSSPQPRLPRAGHLSTTRWQLLFALAFCTGEAWVAPRASLAADTYAIVVKSGVNGTVTPGDTVVVEHGAERTFTMTPAAGYRVRDVKVDGVSVGAVASYTFSAVTSAHTLEAKFSPVPYPAVVLRADSAAGNGPYPSPSSGPPWRDLRGGHDAFPTNFIYNGSLGSGWNGNGTPGSPYRLEFGAAEERMTIPAGSIPELQTVEAVTASAWFQTSYDGPEPRQQYILEWVEPSQRGMAIAIINGELNVYLDVTTHLDNEWEAVAALAPHRWYHVSVAKELDEVRVYVNGHKVFARDSSWLGVQSTPVSIGASCFRISEGMEPPYGEYLYGAIGQVEIWRGALTDGEAFARFASDSALYRPHPELPEPALAVDLRAELGNGSGPHATPGAGSPWADVAGTATSGTLKNFGGTAGSGWAGNGGVGDPHRLQFDGVDDVVTIPAVSVAELQVPVAQTAEIWFKTPADVTSTQVLVEWLESLQRTRGMSIEYSAGQLEVYLGHPGWQPLGAVTPHTWYHVAVVKQPGQVRAYVNGALAYSGHRPHMGDQGTEIVYGGSTWRGTASYGDYLRGAIGRARIWNGALDSAAVRAGFEAERGRYFDYAIVASAGPGGTISPADTTRVPQHGNRTFTITPSPGYALQDVLVDGVSVGAITGYSFEDVLANHTISATFTRYAYTIAAGAGPGGAIAPAGDIQVPHGADQAFAITPDSGYVVTDLLVDGVSVGALTAYAFENVTADHSITASFQALDSTPPSVTVLTPNGGEWYDAGTIRPIEWSATDAGGVANVDLEYSTSGGGSWIPVASAVPNTGSYDWLVPNPPSAGARVRVVVRDTAGNVAADSSDAVFVIATPALGVSDTRVLALAGFRSNPASSDLRVSFSLPDGRPASLQLLDASGRSVRFQDLTSFGPGYHEVDLGHMGRVPAGIYFLRLTHPARTLVTKSVIVP